MTHIPLCTVKGCPTRRKDFKGDPEEWHMCWAKAIKGHKCWGPLDHQHWPKKGMGGHNPDSKIRACLCRAAHDKIDNSPYWGNAVLDVPMIGKVYTIWQVKDRKTIFQRVIEPAGSIPEGAILTSRLPESPPPDEPREGQETEWEQGEQESRAELAAGQGVTFESGKEAVAWLQGSEEPSLPDEQAPADEAEVTAEPEIIQEGTDSQPIDLDALPLDRPVTTDPPFQTPNLPAVSAREQLATASTKGRQALELASSVGEVKDIRDRAEALGTYAKAAHLGLQAQNEMADIKIRAERQAGQLLSDIEREPGKRTATSLQAAITFAGLDSTMAHRWQLEAEIDDLEYEAYQQTCSETGVELTSAGILRLVRALKHQEKPPDVCPDALDGKHTWRCSHCGKAK